MNSTEFKGRPACIYDGWCHVGCPIGALANPRGHLSRRRPQGRRRGARAIDRHARAHQRGGHQGHRRRILRRQEGKAGAGGERRRPCRLVGAESAPDAQLGDRQAPEGARQCKRPARQIHDGALRVGHLGAVRRGRREPHGHRRRAVHVLRPLRQDQQEGRVRQHLSSSPAPRSRPATSAASPMRGSICSASRLPTS